MEKPRPSEGAQAGRSNAEERGWWSKLDTGLEKRARGRTLEALGSHLGAISLATFRLSVKAKVMISVMNSSLRQCSAMPSTVTELYDPNFKEKMSAYTPHLTGPLTLSASVS